MEKIDLEDLALSDELDLDNVIEMQHPDELEHAGSTFGDAWRFVGDQWLEKEPPAAEFLLRYRKDAHAENVDHRNAEPVLRMGKVGMLVAPGGAGKSWALTQLVLSVATREPWLSRFLVDRPGHVAWLAGEEEAEEMHRRIYKAAEAMGLSKSQKALAASRILAVPLCGKPAMLTTGASKSGLGSEETALAAELRDRLNAAGVDWRLIVLDPLSRFAGPDVETDNQTATRFVQTLETLTSVRGSPAVITAHHTNKVARADKATEATAARGSSALTDGVRWQANLDPWPHPVDKDGFPIDKTLPRLAILRVTKSNYAGFPPPVTLARDANGGALRPATKSEIEEYRAALADLKKADKKPKGEGDDNEALPKASDRKADVEW